MKRWLINLLLVLLFPAGIFLMDGCYPNDTISIDQTDVVMTGYYDSVNFKSLSTYYMPDTIFPITDDTTNVEPVKDQDVLLKAIADNMAAYGYTRIYYTDSATPPNVMLAVSAIKITTVNVGWWYPYYPGWGWGWGWGWGYKKSSNDQNYYWGGYPGYYPPGWGWGGVPYYSSYTTGTLLMEMSNPEDYRVVGNDTVVPIYWAGGINGVLSSGSNTSRAIKDIDQAFKQSPEIKTN